MIGVVERFAREHGLLPAGARVLAGVSGGRDSMVMLQVLASLRSRLGFELACSYVDHGIRDDAWRDADLVRDACASHGVAFSLLAGDAPARLRARGGGPEQAAREVRLGLLAGEALGIGATRIALGHTEDDQAETVLMRMMRGTGLDGLVGMRPVRDGLWVRPLLCVDRRQVAAHAVGHGIPFVPDPTNEDLRLLRNRIRLELMPLLDELAPGIASRLSLLGLHAAEARRLLGPVVDEALGALATRDGEERILDRSALVSLDPALAALVVRQTLGELLGDTRGLSRGHVVDVLRLSTSGRGSARLDLPRGVRVVRAYDEIRLSIRSAEPSTPSVEVPVTGEGDHGFGAIRVRVEATGGPVAGLLPFVLRSRRPGDVLHGRSRKLKKLLIDMKVPRRLRDQVPLMVARSGVLWAGGLYDALGPAFKVSMHDDGGSDYLRWLREHPP